MRNSLMMFCSVLVLIGCGGRALPANGGGADGGVDPRNDSGGGQPGKVTVTTDKSSYGTSQNAWGRVNNGTKSSIWLMGCSYFSREFRPTAKEKWQEMGPDRMCGWEGEAVEVKPGASRSQETRLERPGIWRLTMRYGKGCKKGLAMNEKNCQSLHNAVSISVKVTVDKKTCEAINKQYRAAIEPAKKCNPYINMIQCREKVAGDLSCGCPLYVQDRKQLDKHADRWAAYGCSKVMPPCGIKCSPPAPAGCSKEGKCTTGK